MRVPMTGPRRRIAVDVDGTVTADHPEWWNGDFGEPHTEAIEWVNQQYINGHTIMLYTARPESVRHETAAWLRDNGVRYHALVMEKLSAAMYVDNRAVPAKLIQQPSAPDVGEVNDTVSGWFDE